MKLIRKILVRIIGLRAYLKLVSKTYLFLIRLGFLHKDYPELLFLYKLVGKDDNAIDIGANLGYYSKQLKRIFSEGNGKLMAVEPIPLFASVWRSNVGESNQIKLENCALGAKQEKVKMGIPIVDGVVRHGLTKVIEENDNLDNTREYDVEMKVGDEVVSNWFSDHVDFIKCDVEGYEQFVIPNLNESIDKFRPVFQIELGGKDNRENVVDFLNSKGYTTYILDAEKLKFIDRQHIHTVNQDFYFIHEEKKEKYQNLISKT